jgi:hypothetical protein
VFIEYLLCGKSGKLEIYLHIAGKYDRISMQVTIKSRQEAEYEEKRNFVIGSSVS